MSREICPLCNGSGEGVYYTPGRTPDLDVQYTADCRGCAGTGFETPPTLRALREANESFKRSMAAAESALNLVFGRKVS